MNRRVKKAVQGVPAVDGAGVHLTRVLGNWTMEDFDPFLMLDSFDSRNPEDYIKGFPTHPHRGIETITYLVEGEMEHQDSLGNKGTIKSGQAQWMTAGSGIMHQEMPVAMPRILGAQLWLNLPAAEKMTEPKYFDVLVDDIGVHEEEGAVVRVLSGNYKGTTGVTPHHIPATYFDVTLEAKQTITLPVDPEETAFVFLLEGEANIAGARYAEKTAVLMEDGDTIEVSATVQEPVRFLFLAAKPLHEPVAWGGPIVMNTRRELMEAFNDLDTGNFIRHRVEM